jgi:hypothetical protein
VDRLIASNSMINSTLDPFRARKGHITGDGVREQIQSRVDHDGGAGHRRLRRRFAVTTTVGPRSNPLINYSTELAKTISKFLVPGDPITFSSKPQNG